NPLPPNALQRAGKAIQEQAVPMYGLQAAEPSVLMQAEESLGAMAPAALTAAASGPAAPWVGATLFAAQGSGGTEDDPTWTAAENRSMQRVNALLGATEGIPLLRAWGRLTGPVKREIAASALKRYAVRTGRVVGAVGQGGAEEFMQETGSQILGEMWKIKTDNPEMDTVDAAAIATDKVMESDAPKVAFFMGSVFGLLGAGNAAKIEFLDPPVKKWFGENPEKATAVMDRIRAKEALRRADVKNIPGFEKSTADQRAALADSLEMHALALSNSARMEALTGNRPGVETVMPEQSASEAALSPQEAVVEAPIAPVVAETQAASPVVPEQAPEAVAGAKEPWQMTREEAVAGGWGDSWSSVIRRNEGYGKPIPANVREQLAEYDASRAARATPVADPSAQKANVGDVVVRYTHKDGTGLMNRAGLDLSRLTDAEESRLTDLWSTTLQQPGPGTRGVFYFTKNGEARHRELIRLLKKASKTGVVRTETTLKSEPQWQSRDGQIAVEPMTDLGAAPEQAGTQAPPRPPEPGVSPPNPDGLYSIKHAATEDLRGALGLPPRTGQDAFSDQQAIDAAELLMKDEINANLPDRIIGRAKAGEPLSTVHAAVLLRELTRTANGREALWQDRQAAMADGKKSATLKEIDAALKQADKRIDDILDAVEQAGSEQGRSFRFRQLFVNQQMEPVHMIREAEGLRGSPLSEVEKTKIRERAAEAARLREADEARTAAAKEEQAAKAQDETMADVVSEVEKEEAEKEGKAEPKIATLAKKALKALERREKAGWEYLKEIQSRTSANPYADPKLLVALTDIAASKIAHKTADFGQFAAEMLEKVGHWVRPILQDAWDKAQTVVDSEVKKATPLASKKTREKVKAAVNKPAPKPDEDAMGKASRKIASKFKDNDVYSISPYVRAIAKEFIRGGTRDLQVLLDQLMGVIEPVIPGITRRDVGMAFSGYGDFSPLSQDVVEVEYRRARREEQLLLQLQDLEEKGESLKSGKPGAETSKEHRAIQKKINKLKKELAKEAAKKPGYYESAPGQKRHRTAIEAAEIRLRHAIEDMTEEIIAGQQAVRDKGPEVTSPEIEALREVRDEMQKLYDQVFPPKGKPPLTEAQRLNIALKGIRKAIEARKARIETLRRGEMPKKGLRKKTPESPELEALQSENALLKATEAELEAALNPKEDPRTREVLNRQRAIERTMQVMAEEILLRERAVKTTKTPDPQLDTMKAALAELRDVHKQLFPKEARPAKPLSPEKRLELALKAAEKAEAYWQGQLDEVGKAIVSGDFGRFKRKKADRKAAADAKRAEYENPELKAKRDANKKTREEVGKMIRAIESPSENEADNLAYRRRSLEDIAKKKEQMRTKDFAPKTRKEPALDEESLKIKVEREKVAEAWRKAKKQFEWEGKTKLEKAYAIAAGSANASRVILTNFVLDFSAFGRQGWFVLHSRPTVAVKAAKEMFKAWSSKEGQLAVAEQIKSRKNYQDGTYFKAKLIKPLEGGVEGSGGREEMTNSDWIHKVWGIRASARAYDTFMLVLRCDVFDMAQAQMARHTPNIPLSELQSIAYYINTVTGRYPGKRLQSAGPFLNTWLLAPKFVASNWSTGAGVPLWRAMRKGDKMAAKIIAQDYVKSAATIMSLIGLASMFGVDFERRLTHRNFGSFKIGDDWISPFGGIPSVYTFIGRLVCGGRVDPNTGGWRPSRAKKGEKLKYGSQTSWDDVKDYIAGKLHPWPRGTFEKMFGDQFGNYVSWGEALTNMYAPITAQTVVDAWAAEGFDPARFAKLVGAEGAGFGAKPNVYPKN
ncbi:MAG: hypothetical protein M0R06_13800, partial [Sphaerochaeta sp.]|nr:hypothetical protein [Sphaerochaeta sp.]